MTGTSLKGLMPTVLGVTTGVLSVDAIPLLISKFMPSITTGVMLYGVQAATIVGGGMLAKKVGGREAQVAFVAGGIGKVILNFIGSSVLSMIASIGTPATTTTTTTTTAPATSGYGAINQRGMGAMTQSAPLGSLGALASEDSIY
jgi:FtsH-binding integral membrane protein